jgi:hypothetical protein
MGAHSSLAITLAGCLLLTASALAAPSRIDRDADATDAFVAYRGDGAAASHLFAQPPQRVTIAQFMPWRARIKVVLVETDDKVQQSDLGPAPPACQLRCSASERSMPRRLSTISPLRC